MHVKVSIRPPLPPSQKLSPPGPNFPLDGGAYCHSAADKYTDETHWNEPLVFHTSEVNGQCSVQLRRHSGYSALG